MSFSVEYRDALRIAIDDQKRYRLDFGVDRDNYYSNMAPICIMVNGVLKKDDGYMIFELSELPYRQVLNEK